MRVRSMSGQTLGEVVEILESQRDKLWGGASYEIKLDLEGDDPYISLGDYEVPATTQGVESLATFAGIPKKFIMKIDPDERQWLLSSRLERLPKPDTTVYWGDEGIKEVRPANEVRVSVADLAEQALHRMPAESVVDTWWSDAESFRLDVVVPDDWSDTHVYGDPAVGDITKGGVRIGQDRTHNLAPWVQPYLLRLVCTNGLEVPDNGIKVEARKLSADQVVSLFGHEVGRAFDRVEGDLRAFYDLRNQKFGTDGAAVVLKVARESGLPERTARNLATSFDEEDATMFDVVNHLTQAANVISNRRSSSLRALQIAGGSKVYDHSRRCSECYSRVER